MFNGIKDMWDLVFEAGFDIDPQTGDVFKYVEVEINGEKFDTSELVLSSPLVLIPDPSCYQIGFVAATTSDEDLPF
jgi:hypothetical protein